MKEGWFLFHSPLLCNISTTSSSQEHNDDFFFEFSYHEQSMQFGNFFIILFFSISSCGFEKKQNMKLFYTQERLKYSEKTQKKITVISTSYKMHSISMPQIKWSTTILNKKNNKNSERNTNKCALVLIELPTNNWKTVLKEILLEICIRSRT